MLAVAAADLRALRVAFTTAETEQVAVATDVICDLVEDGIEAFPFSLLKRSTLGNACSRS